MSVSIWPFEADFFAVNTHGFNNRCSHCSASPEWMAVRLVRVRNRNQRRFTSLCGHHAKQLAGAEWHAAEKFSQIGWRITDVELERILKMYAIRVNDKYYRTDPSDRAFVVGDVVLDRKDGLTGYVSSLSGGHAAVSDSLGDSTVTEVGVPLHQLLRLTETDPPPKKGPQPGETASPPPTNGEA